MKKKWVGLFIAGMLAGLLLVAGFHFLQDGNGVPVPGSDISDLQYAYLLAQDELYYLFFYSPECNQSLSAGPKLIEAVEQVPVTYYKMNVDEYPDIFETYRHQFRLSGVPVLLRLEQGKVAGGLAGGPESVDIYLTFLQAASRPGPGEDIVTITGKT